MDIGQLMVGMVKFIIDYTIHLMGIVLPTYFFIGFTPIQLLIRINNKRSK